MVFDIKLLTGHPVPEEYLESGDIACYLEITLGSFRERFQSTLFYWSISDYQKQWVHAIERIVNVDNSTSALITELRDPALAGEVVGQWWVLYREGEKVYVQNQLILKKNLTGGFNPLDPYSHIPKRKTETDEGDKISEWEVTVQDMREFLKRQKDRFKTNIAERE